MKTQKKQLQHLLSITLFISILVLLSLNSKAQDYIDKILIGPFSGTEAKFVKIWNHDFHIKSITLSGSGNCVIATGQISHVKAWRPDEQVYYKITKCKGRPTYYEWNYDNHSHKYNGYDPNKRPKNPTWQNTIDYILYRISVS